MFCIFIYSMFTMAQSTRTANVTVLLYSMSLSVRTHLVGRQRYIGYFVAPVYLNDDGLV